jgi:lipid-A-disaccharide synthase
MLDSASYYYHGMAADDLLMVAGEASGDQHGARMLARLRELVPTLRPFGLGGDELQAQGLEAVAHSSEISVVGISEAFAVLGRARRIFRDLLAETERRRPRAAVLIDSPEFNLRLARALHERGVKVVYYVSPQIWAWRVGRVRQIERHVEKMLVLLPFEAEFYAAHGVEAQHVGHPLVDDVPALPQIWERGQPERYAITLLPGSRRSEVERLLPRLVETASRVAARLPADFRLVKAPTLPLDLVERHLAASRVPIEVVEKDRLGALAGSHLALCASGTVTLEAGLLGTPMLVVYRVSFWSYLAGLLLVRLPFVSLVNLVLERRAVPELLQAGADPERIAAEAVSLLQDPDRVGAMRSALGELRGRLGPVGASATAARAVAAVLGR